MFDKFLTLDQEKQERILNAASKEFAQKGFVNASTNEMVKEAGISKGLLFHYFKNKKQLYLFLGTLKLNVSQFLHKWQINKYSVDLFLLYLHKVTQVVIEVLFFCENGYTSPLPPKPISSTFIPI